MLAYLDKKINIQPYPYLDVKNGVFISEDTEYKYENLSQFYKVAKKYNFPVTVFCVASLALKNSALMYKVAKSNLIEIGSHSYSHKKIVGESDKVYKRETIGSKEVLNKYSKQDVIGFRAPREEIDDKMLDLLKDANYKYVLHMAENRVYPYFKDDILILSKHGTDDYSYLINLDWSSKQILREMKKELHVVMNLDGIYTLSTHTHLMTYGSNIKIVDDFIRYITKQKDLHPLNGKMIYDRVSKRVNIHTKSVISDKKMILTISNNNATVVKNLHYDIVVDPTVRIVGVESEIIGLKTMLKKQKKGNYTLVIKSLQPKSQIVLFLKYVQNN
jgi:peptidoglycan/xylan/chitin deacetylase (PgdA/CDA1 family)